jgi:glycosyltransferase involved in cell wall biosynthesis
MPFQDREAKEMRFSVIIPLYNKAPYVNKALESVLSQTFRDFELIVVDDGSTDESLAIAQSVLDKCDLPHRLIHQDNTGVSTARNNGVAVAQGDFVCFLDADDWWAPTFLERMDELILAYPNAGIYGTNYYYVKNGVEKVCLAGIDTGYINYCKVYAERLRMPLTSISVSISRDIFNSYKGFNAALKLGEDFDLWIKIALHSKVAFLNEPLAYYNQDVDPAWRGTGHLVPPQEHMLWNLDYLSEEERTNPDFKELIDNLRTYSLMPYYLSDHFCEDARRELAKVDWFHQSLKNRFLYRMPVSLLKMRHSFLKLCSAFKQRLVRTS